MKLLLQIFNDSFYALTRNFTLLWPFLGFFLAVFLVMGAIPETVTLSDVNPILLLLLFVLFSFSMAFLAGMFHMAYQAINRQLNPKKDIDGKTPPASPLDSFYLLKEFLPGFGGYFPEFLFGGLIHLGLIAGLAFGFQALVDQNGGYPPVVEKLGGFLSQPHSMQELQAYLRTLSGADMAGLENLATLALGLLLIYGVFNLLTMLWPVFVIHQNTPAPHAYIKSVTQFFKDPWRLLLIGLSYPAIHIALVLLLSPTHPILASLRQFLILLSDIWFMLLISRYIIALLPKQLPEGAVGGTFTKDA